MAEYSTVIETWFDADNAAAAEMIVKNLTERVLEHPNVRQVETEQAEEQ